MKSIFKSMSCLVLGAMIVTSMFAQQKKLYPELEGPGPVVIISKDKNGKEIYEGDVLACGDSKVPSQILWNEKWGGWAVKNLKRNEFHRLDIHFNRCIGGNIYENPEMLEEQIGRAHV